MGVAIPQVLTEDRVSGAQIIDGSLRFDSSKSHYLTRTPSSAGNRTTWTWSGWVKRSKGSDYRAIITAGSNNFIFRFENNETLVFYEYTGSDFNAALQSVAVFRDFSSWYHIVFVLDTTNATSADRVRIYVNGQRITSFASSGSYTQGVPSSSYQSYFNNNIEHRIGGDSAYSTRIADGSMSQFYFIDGQALDASYFGYTDALTNTWRPKKLSSSVAFGTNGFYLPFDGSAPIGQDQSGRGNNWTPVNFGGSNTLEKATGALPILNTDGGGKVARVGVRTDSSASSLVLALPLVGIKSDFSNAINSGTSNKAITAAGNAAASSAQSNFYGGSFYFDGTGDYLTTSTSSDFQFGTGDFTIECWVYTTENANYRRFLVNNNTQFDTATVVIRLAGTGGSGGEMQFGYGSYFATKTGISNNKWYHCSISKSGTTTRFFIDGIQFASTTTEYNITRDLFYIGGYYSDTGSEYLNGYVQDVRIYKGTAKYTQNFIPASTDPDILPDTPSGVSYSSNVALVPSTDGAVAFDGSGDYLQLPNSSDFNFGTGDFTFECFAYFPNSSTDYGIFGNSVVGELGIRRFGNGKLMISRNNVAVDSSSNSIISGNIWNHLVIQRSGSTLKMFINGIEDLSTTNTNTYDCSNPRIGTNNGVDLNGFISNLRIVKGTALYTSNFTPPTAPITSVANTKLLCCKSQTSATAADVTPGTITANGNVAATNFNPFTVNINTQRGQESGYATLNPLAKSTDATLSNGNLTFATTGTATYSNSVSTIGVSSGKWYYEFTTNSGPDHFWYNGWAQSGYTPTSNYVGATADSYGYSSYLGQVRTNGSQFVTYSTWRTVGDTIGFALDLDNGKIYFSKNGIWQGGADPSQGTNPTASGLSGTWYAAVSGYDTTNGSINFGQKPFKFPPPAGFQPLALANTPRPTIVRPDQYVGIVTGNFDITKNWNVGFKPDLIWIKSRNNTDTHLLTDSVRGTNSQLFTSSTQAESTFTTAVTSFNRDGFTIGTYGLVSNTSTVAWCWKAGGNSNTYNINDIGYSTAAAAGLTAGSITPTGASVNTKSGFSIIKLTTSASSGTYTVSHGLGKEPAFFITKKTNGTSQWWTYHKSIGQSGYLNLASTAASATDYAWGANPTNSVITYTSDFLSTSSDYIIYSWAEIPGFSKFGSYIGNSSTDGPVIVTGFRPTWILIKQITSSGDGWYIYDTQRNKYNPTNIYLWANGANEDQTSGNFDILSNGFKLRTTASALNYGTTPYTYIYAAFAETPSFNLYGAQANAR